MGPTTDGGDPGEGPAGGQAADIGEAVEAAFGAYVGRLAGSLPEGRDGAALTAAYDVYAAEVAAVFRGQALAGRAWELAVRYFRSLQGDTGPVEAGRYSRLVQTALDVGQGHQRVLDTYQALVTAVLEAAPSVAAGADAAAFAGYVAEVQAAWAVADPAGVVPVAVLAAAQSLLAATSLHGMVLEARR